MTISHTIYLSLILLLLFGCDNGKFEKVYKSDPEKKNAPNKTEENKNDYLDVVTSGYHIRADRFDSLIFLKYKSINDSAYHYVDFKYSNVSDVAFPTFSIGLIGNGHYVREKVYIYNNCFLILPVIGINNYLSFYLIDLNTGTLLTDDVRTSLELIWINNEKQPEIILADRSSSNSTSYSYTFYVCSIVNNEIITKKKKKISFDEDLRYREAAQFKFIEDWLKKYRF